MATTKAASPFAIVLIVLGMLISGTVNTLTIKIQFTMQSVGLNGQVETFKKPWFGTLNMLAAMFLAGSVSELVGRCFAAGEKSSSGKTAPLIENELSTLRNGQPSYFKKCCYVAFPAAFDLLATALCCIGMLYIPASVWQMLRGSSIIFAAIFSILFLKRKMLSFNWLGLLLCVVGVTLVGLANVLGGAGEGQGGGDSGDLVLGMSLVVLGQVVQAAQVIAEEYLMKGVDLPAMQIIGLEGFWGALMMFLVVYPALYALPGEDNGHAEDPFDTFAMLQNSTPLLAMVVVYLFSCGTFNMTGIAVSSVLSGVHRMMFDASRTMVIWAFGLLVHYHFDSSSPFGEALTPYSGLQLFGFLVLVSGQAIYGEIVKVPGLKYPPAGKVALQPSPAQMLNLSSPLPRGEQEL